MSDEVTLTADERNRVCTCTPRSVGLIGRLAHRHECTLHAQAVERILVERIAQARREGAAEAVARVEALAEPLGDYQHYAVALDDGVHLAVLLEDLRVALRRRRCGRLDVHEPHDWTRPRYTPGPEAFVPAAPYRCPGGPPVTEGGWTRCPGCGTSGRPHNVDGEECRESAREKAISQEDA